MKDLKSEEIRAQLEQLRRRISRYQEQLDALEQDLQTVLEQEREKAFYMNSKQIAGTIETYTGKTIDMSTIKRWSDKGYLGPVYDEREKFSALDVGSGKQRNVYERGAVLSFLFNRGYIRPRFSVLDEVQLKHLPGEPHGTVIHCKLGPLGFEYVVQLNESERAVEYVNEDNLLG